jgi:hypothetical protein
MLVMNDQGFQHLLSSKFQLSGEGSVAAGPVARPARAIEFDNAFVFNAVFSPDDRYVATASRDRTARVWDLATGKQTVAFGGHRDWVRTIAYAPDGQTLASASEDKTVKLWDAGTGRELVSFEGHSGGVTSLALAAEGTLVASGSGDGKGGKSGEVRLWDRTTGKELAALPGHGGEVTSVAFAPGARMLATACEDGSLRPREGWSQAIPGRVFTLLRESGITRRDKTYLWGHSAGGQFVHRLLATQPHGIFEAVGTANSGWYTSPTLDLHYPDGLGGIGLTRDDIVRFLGYPLVIFSGDQDIDGTAENFPRHDAAMAQGPNRFLRAQFYLERGRAEAAKLGVVCRWSRVVVPGVAHEGMRMSAFAGDYWFGARR